MLDYGSATTGTRRSTQPHEPITPSPNHAVTPVYGVTSVASLSYLRSKSSPEASIARTCQWKGRNPSLRYKATEGQLAALMRSVAKPLYVTILRNRTGKSRGAATAAFKSQGDAETTATYLDGRPHLGRCLQARLAKEATIVDTHQPLVVEGHCSLFLASPKAANGRTIQVAHGLIGRCFCKRWLGLSINDPLRIMFEPGAISVLRYIHEIDSWCHGTDVKSQPKATKTTILMSRPSTSAYPFRLGRRHSGRLKKHQRSRLSYL